LGRLALVVLKGLKTGILIAVALVAALARADLPGYWRIVAWNEGGDVVAVAEFSGTQPRRPDGVPAKGYMVERTSSKESIGTLFCAPSGTANAVEACQPGEQHPCAVRYETPSCAFDTIIASSPWRNLKLSEQGAIPSVPRVDLVNRRSDWFLVDRRTRRRILSMPKQGYNLRLEDQREGNGRYYVVVSGEGGEIERTEVLFTLPIARLEHGRRH
jgi:hypothetical protein